MARMDQQDRSQLRRIAINVVIEVVALVVLAVVLWSTSYNTLVDTQRGNAALKLETASEHLATAKENAQNTMERFDQTNQGTADLLGYFYRRNAANEGQLEAMLMQFDLQGLWLLDAQGNVTASAAAAQPDLAGAEWDALVGEGAVFTDGATRYYRGTINKDASLVAAFDTKVVAERMARDADLAAALGDISVGETGYVVALSDADGTVAYAPDADLVGQPAAQVFSQVPTAGFDGFLDFDGVNYYVKAASVAGYTFCTMVPEVEFSTNALHKVATVVVAFAVISILIVCYCQFLYTDDRRRETKGVPSDGSFVPLGKKYILNRAFIKKSLPLLVVGTIGVFAVSWYTQTLLSLSIQITHNDNKVLAIEEALEGSAGSSSALEDEYAAEYVDRAVDIAHLVAADPGLIDDERLADLVELTGLESIFIFNENGETVATNTRNKVFVLPSDETDQSYAFWDVVKGVEPSHVQTVVWDGNAGVTFYAGVERYDEKGMVEIGVSSETLGERMAATEFTGIIDSIPVGNGGFLVAVDGETKAVSFMDNEKFIGTPASSHGIGDSALVSGYLGYQTVDGVPCLVSTCYEQGQYVLVCIPTARIGAGDLHASVITALVCFVLLLPIVLQLVVHRRSTYLHGAEDDGAHGERPLSQPRGNFDLKTPGGGTRRVQSISGRWAGGSGLAWSERTPESKLLVIVKGLLLVVTALLLYYVYVLSPQDVSASALDHVMSKRWDPTFNIFSATYIIVMVLTAAVIVWVVRILITMVFRNLNARLETVGRLLSSFIKYAVVIAVLLFALSSIGVDSQSLWASAGIVTLVVGLGAQSLIKDVIAGIFLVFEGEFRVGDIVTVGGWTGTVLEIGIRTTKIEDGSQNIKIFNNSAIADVVNMTKKYSFATVDLTVSYDTPLERFEALLDRELPHIAERLPKIVAGPYYKGVVSIRSHSLVVRVIAQCKESDRGQLTRDLTRQLLLVCDNNDVAPYNGAACERCEAEPAEATSEEKRTAALFVKEQEALVGDLNIEDDPK